MQSNESTQGKALLRLAKLEKTLMEFALSESTSGVLQALDLTEPKRLGVVLLNLEKLVAFLIRHCKQRGETIESMDLQYQKLENQCRKLENDIREHFAFRHEQTLQVEAIERNLSLEQSRRREETAKLRAELNRSQRKIIEVTTRYGQEVRNREAIEQRLARLDQSPMDLSRTNASSEKREFRKPRIVSTNSPFLKQDPQFLALLSGVKPLNPLQPLQNDSISRILSRRMKSSTSLDKSGAEKGNSMELFAKALDSSGQRSFRILDRSRGQQNREGSAGNMSDRTERLRSVRSSCRPYNRTLTATKN
eukprot:TRINITY_DN2276_c0_g1_i1.p1 TRINITY_DN2276_c0_g1~~TRINITY_DN2276_c0_g1_i1.p1  ORF type:complete len:307 (-),score=50.23 TRINITY_DN2276_c0_g1_i1:534-1454(-)